MGFRRRMTKDGAARARLGADGRAMGAALRRFPLSTPAAGTGAGRGPRPVMVSAEDFAAMRTVVSGHQAAPATRAAGEDARRIAADIERAERDLRIWVGGNDGDLSLRQAEERVRLELRHARELHELEARDEAEAIALEQRHEAERAGVQLEELALVEETQRREAEWLRNKHSDGLNSLFERQEIERDHLNRLHALQGKRG